jgi:tetratricopeptide (TPR) repeat protein
MNTEFENFAQKGQMLDSWKEISAYLGRSVRTCQQWEKELDLPIHRLDGTPKARVFAYQEELDRWLEEKLDYKKGKRSSVPALLQKQFFIPALAIGLVCMMAVWYFLLRTQIFPASKEKQSIAILHFTNNTGDEELNHWCVALAQWLMTDLSQSRYIDVLPDNRLFSILSKMKFQDGKNYTKENLEKIADEGQVDHVLLAHISKAGNVYRIDYSILKIDSFEQIIADSVRGEGEESFPGMVDELTRKVKVNFELSKKDISNDIDLDVGDITTHSSKAYSLYAEGRKYFLNGDQSLSRSFMKHAIEIDPKFAMAYRSIAASGEDFEKNFRKAFELRDRTSYRERYQIEGDFYTNVEKNYHKAVEAYQKLLGLYPDDLAGNHSIARVYGILEEGGLAVKHYEMAYQKNKNSVPTMYNLARRYSYDEQFDKAIELCDYYLNNISDNFLVHQILVNVYRMQGNYTLAIEEADKTMAINPTRRLKGQVYYLMEDFPRAEKEYEWILENQKQIGPVSQLQNLYLTQGQFEKAKEKLYEGIEKVKASAPNRNDKLWKARFHNELAFIYLLQGDFEQAMKNAEMGWEGAQEYDFDTFMWQALSMKAYVHVEMKSFDKAEKAAHELKEMIEKSQRPKQIRFHRLVAGKIELERGNMARAVEYLREAKSLDPYGFRNKRANFIEALAYAYYRAGNLEKARKEYESIKLLTDGRLEHGYSYAISHYMLGQIYEKQGKTKKAIENYEKFLEMWKDADADVSEVENARERLTGLEES